MKILVIDDEPLVRLALSRVWESDGCEVLEAGEGQSGIHLWREHNPDLVFLDVLMPGMDGPRVLEEMGPDRSGFVVLISAYTGEHNMDTAKKMGADLFIAKPFDNIFELKRQLEEQLNER